MKSLVKLNLVLLLPIVIAMSTAVWFHYQLVESNALHQVTYQAELILDQTNALRSYTVNEVRPITELNNDDYSSFHPQSVPAYAATQVANLFAKKRPDYRYKEAVFNPTNNRDNAAPWEEAIINKFIADDSQKSILGTRRVGGVKSLYIAKPIQISNPACLECHSTPGLAPASMVAKYGRVNGFGWKLNEIVGIQLVIVPYTLPARLANSSFKSFIYTIAALVFLVLILFNFVLYKLRRPQ